MLALAAVTLSLQLQRTSFDLLDGVDVDVAVHNTSKTAQTVSFPAPAEYELDVYRDDHRIWTSNPEQPITLAIPAHKRQFLPGPTVLALYIWNTVANDGTVPAPGDYTVRAKLLGSGVTPTASVAVRFIDPVPVSALEKLTQGDVVTIAGTLDATKGTLTDASGSVLLMKRLLTVPPGATVAIRGYLTTEPDHTRAFFIQRWAVMR